MSELPQFRDPELAIPRNGVNPEVVGFYPREFFMLDNFASFQIEYGDVIWPTAEHLYQASHFFETHPGLADQILHAPSAHEAYKIARANKQFVPDYWDEIKLELMEEIEKLKLEQHPYIQKKLLETGDLPIVEDSTKDDFWGWGPNHDGRNELGKIWMRLRDELNDGLLANT